YARLAGWVPERGIDQATVDAGGTPALDRWILSRAAALAEDAGARLADFDTLGATRLLSAFIDDLSTWHLRLSRRRMRQGASPADQRAAFATLHAALVTVARTIA